MRTGLGSSRVVLLAGLVSSALLCGFLSPAMPARASGNASLNLSKTVSSAAFVPTMSATLAVDRASAIPGDDLRYTARVTNTGATLTLRGSYTAAEGTDSDAAVV